MPVREPDDAEMREIRALLRGAKLRSTPARILVLRELRRARNPMTHAELAERLMPLGFDKATVFRNLADLTEAEILHRAELGDHVWRFEVRNPDEAHPGSHPHFVCVECGNVTCLEEMEFTAASRERSAEISRITEILIKGHCTTCDARGRKRRGGKLDSTPHAAQ
jgi:Fur family ferric uptake transcriptional regulator